MEEQHDHTDETADTTEQVAQMESPDEVPAEPVYIESAYTAPADEPVATKGSRLRRPLVTAVAAGVVGLGLGAGAMALAGSIGDDGHDRGGDRGHLSDGNMPMDGQNSTFGQNRQMGPMQNHQGRPGQSQQGQNQQGQTGQFQPPNGGGRMQGRSGGS